MVALFIGETEYIVVGSYVAQTMWLRIKLSELQHYQNKLTKIFYNNEYIIALIKNPVFHGRGKHINIKNHYIFYLVKDQEIMAEFCSSKDQVANIFIKTLKIDLFLKFKKMMGMKKFEELGLGF
jgi:hypothetical protein